MDSKDNIMSPEFFEDRLSALGESEMKMFRFLFDRPAGVILTVETDKLLAKLLAADGFVEVDGDKVVMPGQVAADYRRVWSDDVELKWLKRNWMYKCLEAGKYLYGVMTWQVLKELFSLRYPDTDAEEVRTLFESTPVNYQWFTERNGRLVLNGFEQDDYYINLEQQIQRDVPFYIPTAEEVEELYEQGCLISREAHKNLKDFITETFSCDPDVSSYKVHELYEAVNNRVRVSDAVDIFTENSAFGHDKFVFISEEVQFRFIELFIEMSRECRIRDNRGHDYYEMVAIMAMSERKKSSAGDQKNTPVKRVKIGRNAPCPCGSGKKYKNCCGKDPDKAFS